MIFIYLILSIFCCWKNAGARMPIFSEVNIHQHRIIGFTTSTVGGMLAVASSKEIFLYNYQSLEHIGTIDVSANDNSDNPIAFQPNGANLAVNTKDKTILFPLPIKGAKTEFYNTTESSDDFTFSPDGQLLARKLGTTVELWDIKSKALLDKWSVRPLELFTVLEDSIRTSNGEAFDPRKIPLIRMAGRRGWIKAKRKSLTFSPDGNHLAILHEQSIHIWDIENGVESRLISGSSPFGKMIFSPDGRYLATTRPLSGGQVHLWDLFTDGENGYIRDGRFTIDPQQIGTWSARDVTFSSDGRLLALPKGHEILLWDIVQSEVADIIADPSPLGQRPDFHVATLSSDGHWLLVGDWDGVIHVWDTTTMDKLAVLRQHEDSVERIEISEDRRLLLSKGREGTFSSWFIEEGVPAENNDKQDIVVRGLWIPFTLKNKDSVTVQISNSGQIVRTLSIDYSTAQNILTRPRTIYWDGTGADGQPVVLTDYICSVKNGSHLQRHMIIHNQGSFSLR